jgi:formylglycine-generating enzyme required for sulfatase activity
VVVEYAAESIAITAAANHGGAVVSGGGIHSLEVGENPLTITVKAEDGTAGLYTVTAIRALEIREPTNLNLNLTTVVTVPVKDEAPVTAINTDQYTGTIEWRTSGGASFTGGSFAAGTVYQAVVTLQAKEGYTFTGVGADSFTHGGAATIRNAADSGIVTITFPATEPSGGGYTFTTPAQYRAMVQVNSANLTITGSGAAGVFIADRTVTLTPSKIAKYETTWQLWKEVYDWALSDDRGADKYTLNPGREGHDGTPGTNLPVTMITWRDLPAWCNAYSEMSGLTPVYYTDAACTAVLRTNTGAGAASPRVKAGASGYRLPTEAQWECAARGGDPSDPAWAYTYAGGNTAADVAWSDDNAGGGAHPVGGKNPNSLGLCDMSGNMDEYTWDRHAASVGTGPVTDPAGPDTGNFRTSKGGGWFFNTGACEVSNRALQSAGSFSGSVGFRVAQTGN